MDLPAYMGMKILTSVTDQYTNYSRGVLSSESAVVSKREIQPSISLPDIHIYYTHMLLEMM